MQIAKVTVLTAFIVAIGLSGCATERTQTSMLYEVDDSALVDRQFVQQTVQNSATELLSSQLVWQQTKNPAVRDYARQVIVSRTVSNKKLRKITQGERIRETTSPTVDQQRYITGLVNYRGRDFERRYLEAQINSHREMVALFRAHADSGQSPALKRYAQDALPSLERNLQLAQRVASEAGIEVR